MLRAKKPEAVQQRFKMFLWGEAGGGKTTAAIQFPSPYIIDCERGTNNYKALIDASGGAVLQTTDADEVIAEVRALSVEPHDYRTLVIDPITTVEADLIEKAEKEFGMGDMRIWSMRDRRLKRLVNLLYKLDMNVVVTAHGKVDYGDNMKKLGTTHDAWKRWPYVFDLSLELFKSGAVRKARVCKSRLEAFPDGQVFGFSFEEIGRRYDVATMTRKSSPIVLASAEQVAQLNHLLSVVNTPEETVNKWLSKAGVEAFEDMSAETIESCIVFLKRKVETV